MLDKDQFTYFLDLEVNRARRYQNFFCLLVLRIEPLSDGFKDGLKDDYQSMRRLIAEEVRESDLIGLLEENRMVILLPYADSVAGDRAKSRLEDSLKYYDFEHKGYEVMIQRICFPIDGTNTAGILKKTEVGEIE